MNKLELFEKLQLSPEAISCLNFAKESSKSKQTLDIILGFDEPVKSLCLAIKYYIPKRFLSPQEIMLVTLYR